MYTRHSPLLSHARLTAVAKRMLARQGQQGRVSAPSEPNISGEDTGLRRHPPHRSSPSFSSATSGADFGYFTVSQGRMTPDGCECLVTLVPGQRRPLPPSSASSSTEAHAAAGSETPSLPAEVTRTRRVVHGMRPGVRVRGTCAGDYARLRDSGVLPPPSRCAVAVSLPHPASSQGEDGEDGEDGEPRLRQRWQRRRSLRLPCARAARGECRECPWMALGQAGATAEKDAALRAALAGKGDGVAVLEPMTVRAAAGWQQQARLTYDAATRTFSSPALAESKDGAPHAAQHCPLATLELARVAAALSRWAAGLPSGAARQLRGALLSQTSADGARRPWEAQLAVALLLAADPHGWGPQSPLRAPSVSAAGGSAAPVRSAQEQAAVDAVLGAAPLLPRATVHACLLRDGADGAPCAAEWEELYPLVRRHDGGGGFSPSAPPRAARTVPVPGLPPLRVSLPALEDAPTPAVASARLPAVSPAAPASGERPALPRLLWRQPYALETAAALLLTLLLADSRGGAVTTGGGALPARRVRVLGEPADLLGAALLACLRAAPGVALATDGPLDEYAYEPEAAEGDGTAATAAAAAGGGETSARADGEPLPLLLVLLPPPAARSKHSHRSASPPSVHELLLRCAPRHRPPWRRALAVCCGAPPPYTQLASFARAADELLHLCDASAGVVDIDGLSAAAVGYCLAEQHQPNEHTDE